MVDKINKQKMAAEYGFALSFMRSDDELWKLFNQAVKKTWDPNLFIAKLRGTKWFKTHSANVRNAIMQETSDPATYKANVAQMTATVKDAWGKMFGDSMANDDRLAAWAETAHRMGWSEAQLIDRMTKGIDYQKLLTRTKLGGTAAETRDALNQLSEQYGVKVGDQWMANTLKKVLEGSDTMTGVTSRIRELSKRTYAAWADQIDAGMTMSEIADPYRQQMADLLEVNPAEIDLHDNMIQQALKQTTTDGKPAAMSLTAFADKVRQDNRWQYTDNAKQQVASATEGLLRSFGLTS